MTQLSADFLVIGGGIAGMSAAAELAQDASVILLEAEEQLGYHSTGRSAAIFISNYGNATLRALSAAAHPALAGELLGESVLSARGEMLVVQEHELDALANYLEGATGLETLTPDEACALVPVLRRENIAAAVIERGAEDIDVDTLLQGCTRLFKARRGQVIQGARVTALARESGLWQARADGLTVAGSRTHKRGRRLGRSCRRTRRPAPDRPSAHPPLCRAYGRATRVPAPDPLATFRLGR